MEFEYKVIKPVPALVDFVESFWMLTNHLETAKEIVVLPDGRFDIIFSYSSAEPYQVALIGLSSEAEQTVFSPKAVMFAVSLKLLAIECLLDIKAAALLNTAHPLPVDFWGIEKSDLTNFDTFCEKVSAKMLSLIKPNKIGRASCRERVCQYV